MRWSWSPTKGWHWALAFAGVAAWSALWVVLFGDRHGLGHGLLFLVPPWIAMAIEFVRWTHRRSRWPAPPAEVRPAQLALPPALASPPPRPAGSVYAQRAVGRVRAAYVGLLLAPLVLLVVAVQRGSDPVSLAVPVVLAIVFVAFVESNVRAVRRLVREGEVAQGVIDRNQPWGRGGRQVRVSYSREGRLHRVVAQVPEDFELQPGATVPVLALTGSSLAGVVVGPDEIRVGRARAA